VENKSFDTLFIYKLLFISFILPFFILPLISVFLKICFIVSFVLFIWLFLDTRIKIIINKRFLLLLILFVVWGFVSSFFSVNFYEAIQWVYLIIIFFIYSFLASLMLNKHKQRVIFQAVVLFILWIILLFSLFQYFNISTQLTSRIIFMFVSNQYQLANYLSVIISFLFPLIFYYYRNRVTLTFLLITLFTSVAILILLQSMLSFIVLLIGLASIVILVLVDKRLKVYDRGVVVWLLLIPVFVLIIGSILFFVLNRGLFRVSYLNDFISFRVLLWKDSLQMAMQNPLFGVGPGNFLIVFPKFVSKELWNIIIKQGVDSISSPLNDYLQIGSELGVIGIILFLILLIRTLIVGIKRYINADHFFEKIFLLCNLSGLFSISILMLFSSVLSYIVFGFFLFIFIGCLNASEIIFISDKEVKEKKYKFFVKYKVFLFIVLFLFFSVIGGTVNIKRIIGELYYQIGEEYYQSGNYNQALINYKLAENYIPHYVYLYRNYGNALKLTRSYSSAIEVYQKHLKLNPNDFRVYLEIAYCYIMMNNLDEELNALLKAYHIKQDAKVGVEIGNLYHQKGDYQNALNYYERVKNEPFFNPYAGLKLADTYVKLGQIDKALKYLEETKETFKDVFSYYVILGDAYKLKDDDNKAIEDYKRAVEINSKDLSTLIKLAELYKKMKKWNEALIYFENALELDKENENVLINISYCWNNLGEYVKAINTLKEITTRINPKNIDARINLGVVYLKFNLPEYAYREWKEALKINPNNELVKKHIEDLKKNYPKMKFD